MLSRKGGVALGFILVSVVCLPHAGSSGPGAVRCPRFFLGSCFVERLKGGGSIEPDGIPPGEVSWEGDVTLDVAWADSEAWLRLRDVASVAREVSPRFTNRDRHAGSACGSPDPGSRYQAETWSSLVLSTKSCCMQDTRCMRTSICRLSRRVRTLCTRNVRTLSSCTR